MGDTMLLGVLRLPPDLWGKDVVNVAQRHGYYKAAADRIEQDTAKLQELVEAVGQLERSVGKMGCDIDKGSRWVPGYNFSDAMNNLLRVWRKVKADKG